MPHLCFHECFQCQLSLLFKACAIKSTHLPKLSHARAMYQMHSSPARPLERIFVASAVAELQAF